MMLTGRVYSATEGAAYGFSQYLTEAGGALRRRSSSPNASPPMRR